MDKPARAKHPSLVACSRNKNLSDDEVAILGEMRESWTRELLHEAGAGDEAVMRRLLPVLVPAVAELMRTVEYNQRLQQTDPTVRPIDPVAWLASYLYRHNPVHRAGK